MLLVGGVLGYAAGGLFRTEVPAEAPVIEAWNGPPGFSVELADMSLAEIRAMADYNIAVARYQQATGTTLARHSITLAD